MQLLLPSAKSGVMVEVPHHVHHVWTRGKIALAVVGILLVLWGTLDLLSRLPEAQPGDSTLRQAFGPAILFDQQSNLHNP